MTINDLTVNFSHLDRQILLEEWRWLIGLSKQPILVSAIGDAFVQDTKDSSVHLLDTGAGELTLVAASVGEFQSLLTNKQFVMDCFAVEMVADLRRSGIILKPGQIYSFKQPPVLGDDYTLENVEPSDIEVHFALTGQIHRQVKDLPPGTPIMGIDIK